MTSPGFGLVAGAAPAPPWGSTRTDRLLVVSAIALAAWSIAYVIPHLYFALGGTIGLSSVKPSASAAPGLGSPGRLGRLAAIGK